MTDPTDPNYNPDVIKQILQDHGTPAAEGGPRPEGGEGQEGQDAPAPTPGTADEGVTCGCPEAADGVHRLVCEARPDPGSVNEAQLNRIKAAVRGALPAGVGVLAVTFPERREDLNDKTVHGCFIHGDPGNALTQAITVTNSLAHELRLGVEGLAIVLGGCLDGMPEHLALATLGGMVVQAVQMSQLDRDSKNQFIENLKAALDKRAQLIITPGAIR